MDDFTNQIQIEEITSTPTQADWAEYHEWLESQEQDDYEQEDDGQPDEYTEWQDLYGGGRLGPWPIRLRVNRGG